MLCIIKSSAIEVIRFMVLLLVIQIRNVGTNLCIDTKFRGENDRFGLETCQKDNPGQGGEQVRKVVLINIRNLLTKFVYDLDQFVFSWIFQYDGKTVK